MFANGRKELELKKVNPESLKKVVDDFERDHIDDSITLETIRIAEKLWHKFWDDGIKQIKNVKLMPDSGLQLHQIQLKIGNPKAVS
jgi:hypothetical protein